MNAIELLRQQHREQQRLLDEARKGVDPGELFDALKLHAALEEQEFYPATQAARSGDQLREAIEDHLAVKQLVADLLECDPADAQFEPRLALLAEQVAQHVAVEEAQLFPAVLRLLSEDELELLGESMQELAEGLRKPMRDEAPPAHVVD